MKTIIVFVAFFAIGTFALPVVKQKKDEEKHAESTAGTADVETALEYERYLKEVVEALESDQDFRKKLDKAPEADIRSGKIAQELEYVNHQVRTKLDEIKRREIERLRTLANKEFELNNDIDRNHLKVPQHRQQELEHLDHHNEHTFEINDLRKLIKKTSEDLAEADRKRRSEFKEYEMQKEFERESKLKEMDEVHRKEFEEQYKQQQEKHKKHEKVHHPGNKAQLEDVWEKQDHMDKEDFDPHTFFMLHDVDGNGVWDETEVKALFIKELDKVYQSGLPEDDMRERAEEMERMREHVFQESDTNKDGLISFQEFLDQTKRDEFNKDPEWDTVDENPQYTHEEYLEFERRRQEEIQRMVAQGILPPHPNMPQGHYPDGGQMHYQQQQHHNPQVQQVHLNPNQIYEHQQHHNPGVQEVHLSPNQIYEHHQQQPQYQQPHVAQHNQQVPVQQQVHVQQQAQVPVQQQAQAPVQQQVQQVPVQQQAQQVPVQQAQQVPVQQQAQQIPVQQQPQQVPVQQQPQQVPVQQQPQQEPNVQQAGQAHSNNQQQNAPQTQH